MIIKKFQGKTEAEAAEAAKKELGSNMVIMNVRNIKRKGLFSFLLPQLVEVTVALEEEPDRALSMTARGEDKQMAPPGVARSGTLSDGVKASPDGESPAGAGSRQSDFFDVEKQAENNAIEEKLDSLQTLLEQQLQKSDESKEEPKEKEKEKESEKKEEASELERFMKLLYGAMLDNEVNEAYANQIIDEIEKTNKPNMPFDYALTNTYQKMILKFGKPVGITPAEKGSKIVYFVGPTGVGKTTTIAKIASKFSVEGKKKVALLTTDTYRIAAAEQLRTYANILEVPFRVIYSTDEMEQALIDYRGYDFILVDTAGHSPQNVTQREAMNTFLHAVDGRVEKEVFLVLSATTKHRDLISIADTYSAMTDYKLIFTKLDETTTLGNLLNLRLHTGASLSYVTCGQNVPDDIEVFNPQKTVKQLLGGKKD
ncbi:MAG: flagellar biosynthesis protein FlhF [Lachnospiraceae bacterium]|nr:flagellar biosynthesis protein FlhF [Lachnospiraceae bacterium]